MTAAGCWGSALPGTSGTLCGTHFRVVPQAGEEAGGVYPAGPTPHELNIVPGEANSYAAGRPCTWAESALVPKENLQVETDRYLRWEALGVDGDCSHGTSRWAGGYCQCLSDSSFFIPFSEL